MTRPRLSRLRSIGLALLGIVALAGALLGPSAANAEQEPFTVYMAATDQGGDDANDGLTPETAVNTLVRVQEVLREHMPDTDIEVRIDQGTYVAPPFHEWRFYVPGHTISFMPADYEYGDGIDDIAGLPVFQNDTCGDIYCSGFWLQPRLPTDTADPMYDGGNSGLRFYYLQVQYYSSGGISVYGDSERDVDDESYNPPLRQRGSKGLNGNTFFGMQFRKLGNLYSGSDGPFGYGGIVLTNSSNNRITNSHFVNNENAGAEGGYIHGLYITMYSSSNVIERNRFEYISGDPVKFRHLSNYNSIQDNTFSRTGRTSYYRGEFCDEECAIANDIGRQCASYGNRFVYNRVASSYTGGHISDWSLSPEGLTYAGLEPCAIPDGEARVHTAGNDDS